MLRNMLNRHDDPLPVIPFSPCMFSEDDIGVNGHSAGKPLTHLTVSGVAEAGHCGPTRIA